MENKKYQIYILPAFLFIFLATVIPLLGTITLSTFSYDITRPAATAFSGLSNYRDLFGDERFHNSLKVMFIFIVAPVVIQIIFGYFLALALQGRLKGTRWMKGVFLAPSVIPPVVIGLIWKLFLIPQSGGLAYFLHFFGIKSPDLLSNPFQAVMTLIIVSVWAGTPFVSLMYLAALDTISPSYYEAASIDGASWWQRNRVITIPLLMPVTKTLLVFRMLEALSIFPIIFILTGGGPGSSTEPINFYAYIVGFDYMDLDYAAAIIVVFFMILISISLPVLNSLVRKKEG